MCMYSASVKTDITASTKELRQLFALDSVQIIVALRKGDAVFIHWNGKKRNGFDEQSVGLLSEFVNAVKRHIHSCSSRLLSYSRFCIEDETTSRCYE